MRAEPHQYLMMQQECCDGAAVSLSVCLNMLPIRAGENVCSNYIFVPLKQQLQLLDK